jgi:hypothetical protein
MESTDEDCRTVLMRRGYKGLSEGEARMKGEVDDLAGNRAKYKSALKNTEMPNHAMRSTRATLWDAGEHPRGIIRMTRGNDSV